MSGGSFNYLYAKETLLGESACVESMAEYVREKAASKATIWSGEAWVEMTPEDKQDLLSAAAELEKLAVWLRHAEHRCDAKQEFYRGLIKSVEWCCSGDTCADDIVENYRALVETGQ